jgi:hypothetical protein
MFNPPATHTNMLTLHKYTLPTACLTFALLGTSACDLGPKAIGDDAADSGDGDTGDGDTGDTDDGDETGFPQPWIEDCGDEVVSVIDSPQAPLAGFDGVTSDYLADAVGTYLGDFNWWPADGFLNHPYVDSSSPLTMTVSYDGGEIRLFEVELVGQPSENESRTSLCSNTLSVDVTLGFSTADGLFAESMVVPLMVSSHADDTRPRFYFSLDMDAHQGTMALADFDTAEVTATDLVLSANFEDSAVTGGMSIEIETMDWVGFGPMADFAATRQP